MKVTFVFIAFFFQANQIGYILLNWRRWQTYHNKTVSYEHNSLRMKKVEVSHIF